MQKIAKKATLQKDYGQLLAAELRQAMLWNAISSDSLVPAIKRMEMEVEQTNDLMVKVVRYATLGKLYRENSFDIEIDGAEENEAEAVDSCGIEDVFNRRKSAEFFQKALANPELLVKHYSTEYVPLTLKGMDGTSFGNDMLHLIGFEADSKEAYQLMYNYYNK